ncbi:heterochromatin-associated protein MENT-like isoform X2 [Paramacrobiotus metropolitanus]|uniref:heterochromatin-associated protein MENT-like isoform X2 n=1 Tax=Paramacrobiotus metropolitanus TaxID=2943436 RepID=UPI0024460402|nr:heterochromatin-associated protein MENT-like isoform X2 [Paramacrobiotus metropolitanus]
MDYLRKPLDAMTSKLFIAARDLKLKESKSNEEENTIISPFAVTAVAALLYYGSKGEPAHRQLESLLRFGDLFEGNDDAKNVLMAFRAAIKTLTKFRDGNDQEATEQAEELAAQYFQMVLATKIIVQSSVDIQREFADLINRNLNIDIEKLELNFSKHEGEKAIESWLKEKIESRFDVSVPEGLIDAQYNGPRAVIASAAHFRAGWDTPFERSRTFWGPFRLDNGKTKQVQYMNMRQTVPYSCDEHAGIKMVEIPFYQNTASLLLTIPTKAKSIQQLTSMQINWKQLHIDINDVFEKRRHGFGAYGQPRLGRGVSWKTSEHARPPEGAYTCYREQCHLVRGQVTP